MRAQTNTLVIYCTSGSNYFSLGCYFDRSCKSSLHSSSSCLQGRSPDSFPKQQLVIEPKKIYCLQHFYFKKTVNWMRSPSFPMVHQMRSKMQEERKLAFQICILCNVLQDKTQRLLHSSTCIYLTVLVC